MHWGRKVALLMLAAVVLWTAMPASACVLTMQSNARRACCGDNGKGRHDGWHEDDSCLLPNPRSRSRRYPRSSVFS